MDIMVEFHSQWSLLPAMTIAKAQGAYTYAADTMRKADDDMINAEGFYRMGAFPGTAARMHKYEDCAPGLAVAAVEKSCRRVNPETVSKGRPPSAIHASRPAGRTGGQRSVNCPEKPPGSRFPTLDF